MVASVPSAIFFSNRTHAVVTDIPYIFPIVPELFFNLFDSYYSTRNNFLKPIWVYAGSLRLWGDHHFQMLFFLAPGTLGFEFLKYLKFVFKSLMM